MVASTSWELWIERGGHFNVWVARAADGTLIARHSCFGKTRALSRRAGASIAIA